LLHKYSIWLLIRQADQNSREVWLLDVAKGLLVKFCIQSVEAKILSLSKMALYLFGLFFHENLVLEELG